jgi:LEA14-like dessication related protein
MNKYIAIIGLAGIGYGMAWYNDMANVTYLLDNVKFGNIDADGINLIVSIRCTNSSGFTYKVPTITADLLAGNQHLASGMTTEIQTINAHGISYLTITAKVKLTEIANELITIIQSQNLPSGLSITGAVHVGLLNITFPFQTNII